MIKYRESYNLVLCEIQRILDAYMQIVSKYRTVEKMVREHPNLAKYVPNQKEETIIENTEAEVIVEEFEE